MNADERRLKTKFRSAFIGVHRRLVELLLSRLLPVAAAFSLLFGRESRSTVGGVKYAVSLFPTEEGYSVSCPGLPGCWSQGATEEEALANIQAAIREYVEVASAISKD